MNKKADISNQAKSLCQSGFTAFQNKAYKESINYYKRAKALGLNLIDETDANRFIGLAYLELKKSGAARKYLRRATNGALLSSTSILALANAETKRSSLYKWIKGDDHQDKVEELLDWFLLSHLPDQDRLKIVASNALENKKWHKATLLFENLKGFDKSIVEYQTSYILSCFRSGDLFRAYIDIEELFSNSQDPLDGLLAIRAEICLILGKFKQAKEYYSLVAAKDGQDLNSILQTLDVYIRADEVSEEFQQKAILHLMKGYYSTSYINSIDNVDHFELILNAVSSYSEFFHKEQKKRTQELLGSASNQFSTALDALKNDPMAYISKYPKADELLTPFERMEKQQKSDQEAVRELKKLNPVMNTSMIVSFAEQFDRQIKRSGLFLKTRLWFYKLLLLSFRVLLFFIPGAIFIDGLYGAVTGNNLLSVFFPSILSTTAPGGFQILTAVLWFLLLVFADSVLMLKINRAIVDNLRQTLVDYTRLNSFMLVSGEAAFEFLYASQPIPHLEMDISQLMEIGVNEKKPWEIRQGAFLMAETKATSDNLLPYTEYLKKLMNLGDEKLSFGAARLLAITKYPESLPVIATALRNNNHLKTEITAINLALQALAKYGETSSLTILREFAIANLDDPLRVVGCVEAIKLLPIEMRISIVTEILEAIIGKGIEYHTFLGLFEGLGDLAVTPLVTLFNNHHENIDLNDRFALILAILNSGSKLGEDVVKKWLITSEPPEGEHVLLFDMNYDFLIANKKHKLIKDLVDDSSLNERIRKRAASKVAIFEKEKLQDVVFNLWQNDELNEQFIITLGDIGSPQCAEKLLGILEKNFTTPSDLLFNTEYINIFSSLALCGTSGANALHAIINKTESSKSLKIFATAALYGADQDDLTTLRNLKNLLFDDDIDKYHRSQSILISGWCVSRREDAYFKINQRSLPPPKRYYNFLNWVKKNSKLPIEVQQHAEFEIQNANMRDSGRVLWIPRSYNRLEVFIEKVKARLSKRR